MPRPAIMRNLNQTAIRDKLRDNATVYLLGDSTDGFSVLLRHRYWCVTKHGRNDLASLFDLLCLGDSD